MKRSRENQFDFAYFMRRYGAMVFFFLILIYNCIFINNFVNKRTVWNLFIQSFPSMLLGIGSTLVISCSNIDLSAGSTMALAGTIFSVIYNLNIGFWPSFILAVIICTLSGFFTGFLIGKLGMTSMIVTMALMYMFRGIALLLSGGRFIYLEGDFVRSLGFYRFFDILPLQTVIIFIVFIAMYVLVSRTRYGIELEAVGDNMSAAQVSGIDHVKVIIIAYVICAFFSSVAGIEQVIMVLQADAATVGANITFDGIAATVVGGTPMSGGHPNLIGTFFAVLSFQLVAMLVNMLGVHYALAYVIKGLMIVVAVLLQTSGHTTKQ